MIRLTAAQCHEIAALAHNLDELLVSKDSPPRQHTTYVYGAGPMPIPRAQVLVFLDAQIADVTARLRALGVELAPPEPKQ